MDIKIPVDLNKALSLPPCEQVKLPTPSPLKVTLPTGGTLQAFSDLSKGIPTDCALTFSLLGQIAPFLAVSDCLLKLLGLIAPLIDIVKGLGPPPDALKLGAAIPKFLKAVEKVMPCVLVVSGLGVIPFLRDLLCLIIKALNCFLGQMKSLLGVMGGLNLQLLAAQAAGNEDLTTSIRCEQENAQTQAGHLMASVEPIGVVLELAGTLFGIVGKEPIKLPALGSQTDLDSLNQVVQALQGVVGTLQIAADALGGCEG